MPDSQDNCVGIANPGQQDSDGDGVGDVCDNCPGAFNAFQTNVCGVSPSRAPLDATQTLSLQRVRLKAAPNGTVRVTGTLDTTEYGGLAGFVAALRSPLRRLRPGDSPLGMPCRVGHMTADGVADTQQEARAVGRERGALRSVRT